MIKLFSIYDQKAKAFMRPFPAQAEGVAARDFATEVNNPTSPDSNLHLHPEDFSLHYLGEFDELTGTVTPVSPPLVICTALSVYQGAPNQAGSQMPLGVEVTHDA